MCHHEMSPEHSEGCCCSENSEICCCCVEQGFMEKMNDEQKKKIMIMQIDMKIHGMEQKIKHIEGVIEGQRKMIANMRQIQEMIAQSK
jgi:hypothetical protein